MRLHEAENAFPRDSERDHTQTQTRSLEEANAFAAAFTRVHTRRKTRSHEAPEANAFARTGQRTRLHERYCTIRIRAELQCYNGLEIMLTETTALA